MRTLIQFNAKQFQRAALCALVFFCGSHSIAAAAPSEQQIAAYEAAPENERVKLLIHLAKSGNHNDAAQLLEQFPLEGPHAANRTLFIEGLILRANGDLTGAAENFRAALANDPSLTLVRAELAQTLVVLQEDDSAKHHLKLLAADAPNEEAAQGVRSFLDQVDSRKPYKFSGYVSLAPSTNLNSGSKHTTVYSPVFGAALDIDDASQAKSGIGVASGVKAAYSKRLGNDFTFVAAGSADARLFNDPDFNSYSLSQSIEMRHLVKHGYVGLGAVASQSLENDDFGLSYISYGPRMSASLQLTAKNHLSSSATYEWRDNLQSGGTDGTALMFDAAWTHGFNSSFSGTLLGGYDVINSDVDQQSYNSITGGLSIYKELPFGITTNASAIIAKNDFEGYYALAGAFRKDKRLTGSVQVTKRDWNLYGFAPSLSYTYTNNLSNISLYDFDNHAVDFRLTKDF
jgi:outer membrane protein